ncbi:AMIN-like domain-containing (lipo)protein [Actinopolymorpha pittospori]
MRVRALLLTAVVALALAGCSRAADNPAKPDDPARAAAVEQTQTTPPTPTPSATASATAPGSPSPRPSRSAGAPMARSTPSKEFGRQPQQNYSDAAARIVGLDVARGSGVETVTFTFADTKVLPQYRVGYVDVVRAHPEDDPIAVEGTAFLDVSFSLTNPNIRGRLAVPPDLSPELPTVRQILLVRNLGGSLRFAVGLQTRAEFRVRELKEPTRLVVEVREP